MKLKQFISVFALFLSTLIGFAYAANLDAKKSKVTITAKQMNVPMNAQFGKLSAVIDYNPEKPDSTQVKVEIDIASFDLGAPEYNKEVLKKDWFNATQFPKATFVSTTMKSAGSGKMTATGKLTIKGITQDVSFPVTLSKEGVATVFDGALPIHRLAFHVGEGDWSDTSVVADLVDIHFHVVVQ